MHDKVDTSKARVYYWDGTIEHFDDPSLAYRVWLSAKPDVAVAFRGRNDTEPVYAWDYVRP